MPRFCTATHGYPLLLGVVEALLALVAAAGRARFAVVVPWMALVFAIGVPLSRSRRSDEVGPIAFLLTALGFPLAKMLTQTDGVAEWFGGAQLLGWSVSLFRVVLVTVLLTVGAVILAALLMLSRMRLPPCGDSRANAKTTVLRVASAVATAWSPRASWRSLFERGSLAPLDGVRALAVLWVVCYHVSSYPSALGTSRIGRASKLANAAGQEWSTWPCTWFVQNGDLGVDLFFVLSGFLIGHMLFKELDRAAGRVRVGVFLLRRWLRIMPAYYGVIVASSFVQPPDAASSGALRWLWAAPEWWPFTSDARCADHWWQNALFVSNLRFGPYWGREALPRLGGCVGHGWSISLEFQFYCASPLVTLSMWAIARNLRRPRLAVAAPLLVGCASVAARPWHAGEWRLGGQCPELWCRCSPYCCGLAAALAVRLVDDGTLPRPASRAWAALHRCAMVGWVLLSAGGTGDDYYRGAKGDFLNRDAKWLATLLNLGGGPLLGASVAYALAMCLLGRAPRLSRLLSLRIFTPIARLSYGIYLYQMARMRIDVFLPDRKVRLEYTMIDNPQPVSAWDVQAAFLGATGIALLSATAFALVSYFVLERPFMALRVGGLSAPAAAQKAVGRSVGLARPDVTGGAADGTSQRESGCTALAVAYAYVYVLGTLLCVGGFTVLSWAVAKHF